MFQDEKVKVYLKDGEPVAFIRRHQSGQYVIYGLEALNDEEIATLFSNIDQKI